MWLGSAPTGTDFAYVTVSDGVGVGIVVDGQVVRGQHSVAGEFGHISIDTNGPRCPCGARGCWEAYTSNIATVTRHLGRAVVPGSTRNLLQSMPVTMPEIVARARNGESRAIAVLRETGRYLGVGLAMVIAALNPGRFSLVVKSPRPGISLRTRCAPPFVSVRSQRPRQRPPSLRMG
jgi:N-acetylglucosamine repressor